MKEFTVSIRVSLGPESSGGLPPPWRMQGARLCFGKLWEKTVCCFPQSFGGLWRVLRCLLHPQDVKDKFGVICALIWSTQSPSTSYIPSEKKLKTVFAESVHAKLLQSCPTLCDPVDCSPPGCSVQGTLQARILEWVATPFTRGPSWPRDRTRIPLSLLPW